MILGYRCHGQRGRRRRACASGPRRGGAGARPGRERRVGGWVQESQVLSTVTEITGTEPRTFEEWARTNAAAFSLTRE
jgi:hypothetical protein